MSSVGGGKKKQISIRGVDEDLYKQISLLARELGVNVGSLINQAIKTFLSLPPEVRTPARLLKAAVEFPAEFTSGLVDSTGLVISDVSSLTISRGDLESVDGKVSFRGIERLEFKEDVDEELFNSKVRSVAYCNEIVIPRTLRKLTVLAKCRKIGKVTETG